MSVDAGKVLGFNEMIEGLMGKAADRPWYHSFTYPETPNFNATELISVAASAIYGQAVMSGKTCHLLNQGITPLTKDVKDKLVGHFNAHLALQSYDRWNVSFYVFDRGAIQISDINSGIQRLAVVSLEKEDLEYVRNLLPDIDL